MKKQRKLIVGLSVGFAVPVLAVASFAAVQPQFRYIASGSMEPTLQVDSYIAVQENPYQNISQVKRGDIITYMRFDATSKMKMMVVQRVIALPGDKVKVSGTRVSINGKVLPHTLTGRMQTNSKYFPKNITFYQESNGKARYQVQYGDNTSPGPTFSSVVPKDKLLCLGDNRDNSYDSRYTGAVPFKAVVGKKIS